MRRFSKIFGNLKKVLAKSDERVRFGRSFLKHRKRSFQSVPQVSQGEAVFEKLKNSKISLAKVNEKVRFGRSFLKHRKRSFRSENKNAERDEKKKFEENLKNLRKVLDELVKVVRYRAFSQKAGNERKFFENY